MANNNRAQRGVDPNRQIPLVWIGLAVVILAVAGIYIWSTRPQVEFRLQEGPDELLVLIRNQRDGAYQVNYEGREPVQLESLNVILGGQILHVDVVQVAIQYQGREVVLSQPRGELPAGQEITLQPGDTFTATITFRGQTLGGNFFKGFRVGYSTDGQTSTYDMEVGNDYAILVE